MAVELVNSSRADDGGAKLIEKTLAYQMIDSFTIVLVLSAALLHALERHRRPGGYGAGGGVRIGVSDAAVLADPIRPRLDRYRRPYSGTPVASSRSRVLTRSAMGHAFLLARGFAPLFAIAIAFALLGLKVLTIASLSPPLAPGLEHQDGPQRVLPVAGAGQVLGPFSRIGRTEIARRRRGASGRAASRPSRAAVRAARRRSARRSPSWAGRSGRRAHSGRGPAQQPLALAVADLQTSGSARRTRRPVVEQRHARLQADAIVGAIDLRQDVVRQVVDMSMYMHAVRRSSECRATARIGSTAARLAAAEHERVRVRASADTSRR